MANLELNINGNADSAKAAFEALAQATKNLNEATSKLTSQTKENNDEVGKSVVKWQEFLNIAKQVVGAVVKFGVDAVKAYAEAERVQKQLVRAAGSYADAIDEQSTALSKLNAVDDDIIKQSAILLTQWGGVGAATKEVQQAILDYAAATGTDAVAATQDLIRNVESGGTGLAKLGVHFKASGDKGRDLAGAVEALNKKFGGAAKADATSLHGSLGAVNLAWDDFVKATGASIAKLLQASGAIEATRKVLIGLKDAMEGEDEEKVKAGVEREKQRYKMQQDIAVLQTRYEESLKTAATLSGPAAQAYAGALAGLKAELDAAKKALDDLNLGVAKAALEGIQGPKAPPVVGVTNYGMKNADAAAEAARREQEQVAEADAKRNEEWRQRELEAQEAAAQESIKIEEERVKEATDAFNEERRQALANLEAQAKDREDQFKAQLKQIQIQDAQIEKENAEHLRRIAEQDAQARQAGDAIGAAFVNALTDQLAKLSDGGEFDAAMFVGEILASVIAIAGNVIGAAYGQPALGAAIGNLAAMGVRMGASAISSSRKKGGKKYHEGGWVGDEAEIPRYHSGTWVGSDERPAILQTGERVLSRLEVNRMGGQAGVDAAARGRPAVNVYLSAIDSKSAADSFVSDLGDGLRDALRRGRGSLAPLLLGASPR